MRFRSLLLILIGTALFSCELQENGKPTEKLTIFFVHDQHGQIENFARIKHIVDQEKLETRTLLVCSGDIFSGNPVVDQHPEKGYPMIDLMNAVGFDISVIGNHEYDYGQEILAERYNQAEFEWVCANVDMNNSLVPQPQDYFSFDMEGLKVTFLGLVETYGSPTKVIPSTHPWRVNGLDFQYPGDILDQFSGLKSQEESDLLIALTHLGHNYSNDQLLGDFDIAKQFPYFDLIVGGHTNQLLDTVINNTPIFQCGYNLQNLGKIQLGIRDKKVVSYEYDILDLSNYTEEDPGIRQKIDEYFSDASYLNDVIGSSAKYHSRSEVGCFVSDALREEMNVDLSIQNSGGVRASLDEGDIQKVEIYQIDPFNNQALIYTMTVGEITDFLEASFGGFYYSGLTIVQEGQEVVIKDDQGNNLDENTSITLGINDYTPAVYEDYFSNPDIQQYSTAEAIITYLETNPAEISYNECTRYFRMQ